MMLFKQSVKASLLKSLMTLLPVTVVSPLLSLLQSLQMQSQKAMLQRTNMVYQLFPLRLTLSLRMNKELIQVSEK